MQIKNNLNYNLYNPISKSKLYWQNFYNEREKAKKIIKNHVNTNDIQSIFKCMDFGRFFNPLNLFNTRIKLYNIPNKNSNIKKRYSHYITCYFDKFNNLKKILNLDNISQQMQILDNTGKIIREYTRDEFLSLFNYKRDSKYIHDFLRNKCIDMNYKSFFANFTINSLVDNLSKLFLNKTKVDTTKKEITVYRVLDKNSLQKIKKILKQKNKCNIFEDNSFMSVTTRKNKIFNFIKFNNFNYVLRIKVPKNTKYISLDEIGNSVVVQPNEYELLFNKNTKLKILGRKHKLGFVDAELINEK